MTMIGFRTIWPGRFNHSVWFPSFLPIRRPAKNTVVPQQPLRPQFDQTRPAKQADGRQTNKTLEAESKETKFDQTLGSRQKLQGIINNQADHKGPPHLRSAIHENFILGTFDLRLSLYMT